MSVLTIEIILVVVVVLALFGFFLRLVSQEQGSVEKLSSQINSMELGQRQKEAALHTRIVSSKISKANDANYYHKVVGEMQPHIPSR